MKAIEFDAQQVRCIDIASPFPSDRELLVEVLYAGFFLHDTSFGNQGCGRVLKDPLDEVAPGTVVAWSDATGPIAEQVVVDRSRVVAVSDLIAPHIGASMLRPGMAASYSLFEILKLVQGEAVVVTNAGSAIGLYMIAIAREKDIIVYAVSESEEGRVAADKAGATAVFSGQPGTAAQIKALNDGIGVDAVVLARSDFKNGFAHEVGRSSARTCCYEDLASIRMDANGFRKHAQTVTRVLEETRWEPPVHVCESIDDASSLLGSETSEVCDNDLGAIKLQGSTS